MTETPQPKWPRPWVVTDPQNGYWTINDATGHYVEDADAGDPVCFASRELAEYIVSCVNAAEEQRHATDPGSASPERDTHEDPDNCAACGKPASYRDPGGVYTRTRTYHPACVEPGSASEPQKCPTGACSSLLLCRCVQPALKCRKGCDSEHYVNCNCSDGRGRCDVCHASTPPAQPKIERAPRLWQTVERNTKKPWQVVMICCARDDGMEGFDSWDEADAFRNQYVATSEPNGHQRQGILYSLNPASTPPARSEVEGRAADFLIQMDATNEEWEGMHDRALNLIRDLASALSAAEVQVDYERERNWNNTAMHDYEMAALRSLSVQPPEVERLVEAVQTMGSDDHSGYPHGDKHVVMPKECPVCVALSALLDSQRTKP